MKKKGFFLVELGSDSGMEPYEAWGAARNGAGRC